MVVLLVSGIVALLLTYFASKDEIPFGLEIAFLLIAFIAAIHYNYGNDYSNYVRIFENITKYDFSFNGLINHKFYRENGWALLCFIFKPIGFLWMVVFLSIAENIAYYVFIRFYVPKNGWTLALFIYLTSKCLYVLNMSMMRQGFTIAMFVLLWPLLKNKNIPKIALAGCLIWLLSTFHSSAIIIIPIIFWGFVPMKSGKINGIVLLILFLIFMFSVDLINSILISMSDIEDLQHYFSKYSDRGNTRFGFGFLLLTLPFIIGVCFLIFNKKATIEEKQIVTIASIGSLIVPFTQVISLIGRVGYYFTPFTLASIPITYRWLPDPWKKIFVALFLFISCYDYWYFFHSEVFSEYYLNFHSIFEVIF